MLRFGGSALQLLRGLKVPSGASQNLTIHLILRSYSRGSICSGRQGHKFRITSLPSHSTKNRGEVSAPGGTSNARVQRRRTGRVQSEKARRKNPRHHRGGRRHGGLLGARPDQSLSLPSLRDRNLFLLRGWRREAHEGRILDAEDGSLRD